MSTNSGLIHIRTLLHITRRLTSAHLSTVPLWDFLTPHHSKRKFSRKWESRLIKWSFAFVFHKGTPESWWEPILEKRNWPEFFPPCQFPRGLLPTRNHNAERDITELFSPIERMIVPDRWRSQHGWWHDLDQGRRIRESLRDSVQILLDFVFFLLNYI